MNPEPEERISPGGPRASAASRLRPRLLLYLAPAILVSVALQQIVLSHRYALNPWKGGGFGMFASVDLPQNRIMRGFLVVRGREVPMDLGAVNWLDRPMNRGLALPTRARLLGLAERLAERTWSLNPDSPAASPAAGRSGPGQPIRPSAVRLEVYRIYFDAPSLEVERLLLAEATLDLP